MANEQPTREQEQQRLLDEALAVPGIAELARTYEKVGRAAGSQFTMVTSAVRYSTGGNA